MKKMVAFMLLVALMVSMAVPAFAATASAGGTAEDLVPEVAPVAPAAPAEPGEEEEETEGLVISAETEYFEIFSTEEVEDLSEEAQETFAESKEALEAAVPEGMAVRYFFYCETDEVTDAVFNLEQITDLMVGEGQQSMENIEDLVFMQYIDGKWVELEFVINEDGTVTVFGITSAPMAIFVKKGE